MIQITIEDGCAVMRLVRDDRKLRALQCELENPNTFTLKDTKMVGMLAEQGMKAWAVTKDTDDEEVGKQAWFDSLDEAMKDGEK